MKVLTWPNDSLEGLGPTTSTIGVFDGLHLGHQEVFRLLFEGKADLPTCALTFYPHPKEILTKRPVPLLMSLDERLAALEKLGLDMAVVLTFSAEFARLRAETFFDRFLESGLGVRRLVIGYDLCIGHKQEANASLIRQMGAARGIDVLVVPPKQTPEGEKISSSLVRQQLEAGDVEQAAILLGRPYAFRGTVYRDRGMGAQLGFPTANLALPPGLMVPATGVYATWVTIEGEEGQGFAGALNVGKRPTTTTEQKIVPEVHLLEYQGPDLVGKTLLVQVQNRLRPEQKFTSVESLRAQIEKDVGDVRLFFMKAPVKEL